MLPLSACGAPLVEEQVRLDVDALALPAVHDVLHRFWTEAATVLPRSGPSSWRLEFGTALLEIASNIFRHAYPPEQRPASFSLQLRLFPQCAVAVLTDTGVALPVRLPASRLPDPLALDLDDLPEAGMGLAVAQAAVDELDYQRDGDANVWRLSKRFREV